MAGTWKETGSTTKDDVTTKTFTYTDSATNKVVATLSGISGNAKVVNGAIAGITVGEGTIGLANEVLTNANVTLKTSNGGKYALTFVGTVDKVKATDVTATASGGTVTLTGKTSKGYELTNATTVTYVKAQGNQKLVTITGLNTKLGVTEGKIGYTPEGGSFTEYVTYDATTGNVTLKDGALGEKDAKLALNYIYSPFKNLALDGVQAPEFSGDWNYGTKGKAIFKGTVDTAGYRLSLDGKIVAYTAKNSDTKDLVTISGVKDPDTVYLTDISETAKSATNNATITLPAAALNQAAVSVTTGTGYVLELGTGVNQADVANNDIWVAKGTTYTYKTVRPEYYTYDAATNKVTYTKQADVKTLATVSNLIKDLTVGTDETGETPKSVLTNGTDTVVSIDSNKVITVGEDALNKGNVTLQNGTNETYKLKLANGIDAPGVETNSTTWKVSGTTATLSGKTTEGYANSNDTTITYVADGKTIDLAKVKGLAKGIALGKKDTDWEGKVGIAGKDANGDYTFTEGLSEDNGVITVSANVLGTTNATITPAAGYTYKFALDKGSSTNDGGAVPTQAEDTHFWYNKGKALLIKTGKARFYTLTDSTTITETDEVVGEQGATINGLKTGLKIVDNEIDGITVSGKSIILSKDVLNKANVTLTGNTGGYALALEGGTALNAKESLMWIVDGTTADLAECISEGYILTGGTVKYSKVDPGDTVATITGLKNGLKVNDDGSIDGIKIGKYDETEEVFKESVTGKEIQLSQNVLGKTDVVVDAVGIGNDYTLTLDKAITPITLEGKWSASNGTVTYIVTPTATGYQEANVYDETNTDELVSSKIIYKTKTAVKTNITGLDKTLSATDADSISGITEPDSDGVIKLSESVLAKGNAQLKNASGGTYTLALDNVTAPEKGTLTWVPDSKTKTKATLQGVVNTPGWELSADALSVVYTPATDTDTDPDAVSTLATVTGLKSGLTAEELEDGITRNGSVLTLSDDVLGGTNLTVSGGTYKLAIANEDSTKSTETTGWVANGTTATYKTYLTGYYTPDAKGTTVKYTKPTAGTTYATLKGIAKDADLSSLGTSKTVTLNSDVLGTSNVTITGSGYSIKLANGVPTKAENVTEWVTNGTTATYKKYDKGYYTPSNSTTIKYTKPTGGTNIATIKGIANGATIESSNVSTDATRNTIVTLNANQLAEKNVTISGSGYFLKLGSDVTELATSTGKWWERSGSSAVYKDELSKGYIKTDDPTTTITYLSKPRTDTLATVSGLVSTKDKQATKEGVKGYDYTSSISGIKADENEPTITVSEDLFPTKNNAKVTLKSTDYSFAQGTLDEVDETDTPQWTLNKNKGTAVYARTVGGGFTLADDEKSITYTAATTKTLATITGLDKNKLKSNDYASIFTDNEYTNASLEEYGIKVGKVNDVDTIALTKNTFLGTGKVTLNKKDGYIFNIDAIKPAEGSNKWAVNGTTATYSKTTAAGYKLTDTTSVAYVKEVVGDPIVTITGLKKGLKPSNDGSTVGVWNKTAKDVTEAGIILRSSSIDLNSSVLGTTNIQLTNNGTKTYKFNEIGSNEPHEEQQWTFSNGTATYKNIQTGGFTRSDDKFSLAYTAPKTTTLATIKGLNKTFTGDLDDALSVYNGTITVSKNIVTTGNVTLTLPKNGDPYSLAIGTGIDQQTEATTEWVTSGTTATYKTYEPGYYTLHASGNSIVYHKPTAGTTFATVKGLKSGAVISSSDFEGGTTTGGTIKLSAKHLGTTNVSVSVPNTNKSATFTLSLVGDAPIAEEKNVSEWVTTGTKAIYKEYDKGYFSINDKGVAVYNKGTNAKGTEYATITGASGDLTNTVNGKIFMLTSDGLSNKITIASKADTSTKETEYAFNFNTTYNNSAITASANNDSITALGDKLTITGGKGDDTITLSTNTTRAGNTIIYSNGDGKDTIENFTGKDILQIKGFKEDWYDGNNTITIDNNNTLELKFVTGSEPKQINIGGTLYNTSYSTDPTANVLLADDNYSMDAASLSEIVNPVAASYTPYDFTSNFSLTKEDKLTPQISYSGNDK